MSSCNRRHLHAFADPGLALFRTLASKVNDLSAGDNEWVVRWPHNHRAMMRWDKGDTKIPQSAADRLAVLLKAR